MTLLGSAVWCFALAGAGWGLGTSYRSVHDSFGYVDYAVAGIIVGAILALIVYRRANRPVREAAD